MRSPGKYLLVQTTQSLDDFARLAKEKSRELIAKHKGIGWSQAQAKEAFIGSLEIGFINTPNAQEFPEVYKLYLKNFPIKAEQESYDGFNEALGYNTNQAMQDKYGPFEEGFVFARDPATGKIVGAVDFSTYNLHQEAEASRHVDGTQHLIYCFVDPAYRKMGVASALMKAADERSKQFIAETSKHKKPLGRISVLSINEQNQPEKMSLHDYFLDTKSAGIDQYDRLAYWNNRGFRRLSFDYVQPPLEEGGEACHGLSLYARAKDHVHSSVVLAHLKRFFSTTVMKNKPAETNAEWRTQASHLGALNAIKLEGVSPEMLKAKKEGVWTLMQEENAKKRGLYHARTIGELLSKHHANVPTKRTGVTASLPSMTR